MFEIYEEMKRFNNFDDQDVDNLKSLGPVFDKHGAAITDAFYEQLGQFEETAKLLEGRVDSLKATHKRWMRELFTGDYGQAYFDNRRRIGDAHVRINLSPYYVEGVMAFLRRAGLEAINAEVPDRGEAQKKYQSLLKMLDLDLFIINLSYSEERLSRLVKFTGMSRKLIERCINHSK
ncbi:MAG: protoglobin domain-containing protein [Myxococcota bacterium]